MAYLQHISFQNTFVLSERYSIKDGGSCRDSYTPLTTSWQKCAEAAKFLGFSDANVQQVSDVMNDNGRPKGCFRSKENGRFRFNTGLGTTHQDGDAILCIGEYSIQGVMTIHGFMYLSLLNYVNNLFVQKTVDHLLKI